MKTYHLNDRNAHKYFERVNQNCKLLECNNFSINEYIDPDLRLEEIHQCGNNEYRMSPDGICGIKFLTQFYEGDKLVEAYSCIRNKIVLWPKHRQNINQRRYAIFRDRIDFTIYDVKRYYEDKLGESKLVVKDFLSAKFLDDIGSFGDFISEYELSSFIDSKTLMVKNLVTGTAISNYEEYSFTTNDNKKYIQNLLDTLAKR